MAFLGGARSPLTKKLGGIMSKVLVIYDNRNVIFIGGFHQKTASRNIYNKE